MKRGIEPTRLQPFDLTRYLGSEERGVPPPYTSAEISVLSAGTIGLLLALAIPSQAGMIAAAHATNRYNRRRFHPRPPK